MPGTGPGPPYTMAAKIDMAPTFYVGKKQEQLSVKMDELGKYRLAWKSILKAEQIHA